MKKISVAVFFCTLIFAIGAFAFQSPNARPNTGQMGAPATQSPQMTQPSQSTPPSAPDQTPQTPQAPQSRVSNIDEQVKVLADQLNLNPDQQSKVKSILMDQHQQAMSLIQDNSVPRETKVEKIHSLRASTIDKVRQLLTAEQKPKFDDMVRQQDERIRQQSGTSSNPSSSTPPPSSSPGSSSPSSTSPGTNPPASNPPTGAKPPQ